MKLLKCISKSRYFKQLFKENDSKIRKLRSVLSDRKSEETLTLILKAYTTVLRKPEDYLQKAADGICDAFHFVTDDGYKVYGTQNPYFLQEIFKLEKDMVFLDGGGYIGDTVELLFKTLKGPCKYAYSFEPNRENYEKLVKKTERFRDCVRCINAGLDDHEGTAHFIIDDAGSRICENGTEIIQVIDSGRFLNGLTENQPTFIKLDIEGKEIPVIESIRDYIREEKPDLAISVYHEPEHLWRIPLLLHEINKDYNIYLRHQSNYFTETVCYATMKDT